MDIKKRNQIRLHIMNLVLLAVVGGLALYDRKTGVQNAALIGSTLLAILLIVPRIMHLPRLKKWHADLLAIAEQSKWLGIWVFIWFAFHALLAVLTYYGVPTNLVSFLQFDTSQPIVLGFLSLTILTVLAAFSNQWSYDHVKWWKHIGMLVWAIPVFGLTHSLLAANMFRGELPLLVIAPTLFAITAVVGFTSIFAKDKKKFNPWRVTILACAAAIALAVVFAYPKG